MRFLANKVSNLLWNMDIWYVKWFDFTIELEDISEIWIWVNLLSYNLLGRFSLFESSVFLVVVESQFLGSPLLDAYVENSKSSDNDNDCKNDYNDCGLALLGWCIIATSSWDVWFLLIVWVFQSHGQGDVLCLTRQIEDRVVILGDDTSKDPIIASFVHKKWESANFISIFQCILDQHLILWNF